MSETATLAANTPPGAKKFAARATPANLSSVQTLYSLGQCTPDLSSSDCDRCLRFAIGNLRRGSQGGRVLSPSCNVRYEIYPFYNQTGVAPPPAPTSGGNGNGRRSWPIDTLWYSVMQQDNFSDANKLGEGAFGDVYKGVLPNKQEIAVKRLSRGSGQGAEEFKNEVVSCKTRPTGLVETVQDNRRDCSWYALSACGFSAANHPRDLKANILLDGDMNPKISDFGMARISGSIKLKEPQKVVGTYGYMSPEYAMHGQFSVKSDAYSFGVLVLEIISGQSGWKRMGTRYLRLPTMLLNNVGFTCSLVEFTLLVLLEWLLACNLLF
ncbi:hypothetical protein F3Y22_tig00111783pilonHSYRG00451 [Hibiscus syriacus]|uniref:Uncharacterized protein n=1 Tax=Hibiscus syriacus TaxID=106335 RepID=A0A6A2Y0H1_HIBSY|nr:hypothetical protein F3Y22_tig00111783pilonHSYRG00451 [Hibiscus syriacus]